MPSLVELIVLELIALLECEQAMCHYLSRTKAVLVYDLPCISTTARISSALFSDVLRKRNDVSYFPIQQVNGDVHFLCKREMGDRRLPCCQTAEGFCRAVLACYNKTPSADPASSPLNSRSEPNLNQVGSLPPGSASSLR